MNNYKRYFSLLLSICLIFSVFATPFISYAQSSDFENHWAKSQIEKWIEAGLVNGYSDGYFKPNKNITRAEFVMLANNIFGYSDIDNVQFSDVKDTDWFYDCVIKAKTAGYISGYEDGTFKPNSEISRQETTKIIYHILRLEKIDLDTLKKFTDSKEIGWSKDFIGAAVSKGYLSGYPDGSIKPNKAITRAEAIVMLIE